mgnify:CR=1 FL=1
MKLREVDKAWNRLFEHYDILNQVEKNGTFEIDAKDIRKIGGYPPRLSTKFDNKTDLPLVFQQYHLSILPITRGRYVIGHFDVFANLEIDNFDTPKKMSLPDAVQSIEYKDITSESIALNVAHASGMIDDVLDEEITFLTQSGRMGSGVLDFKIKNKITEELESIQVNNSQVEVDGGYEGIESLGIIEAKNNVPMDFMVRQLYYPFLLFKNRLSNKCIKPIFFTYYQNVFSFFEYQFEDPNEYSSIKKVNQKNYILDVFEDIDIQEILDIYYSIEPKPEPSSRIAPFPQADYFGRVMNLLDFLNTRDGRTKDEITQKYSFNDRQSDYYWNALVYLGLADKQKRGQNRKLNQRGREIANNSLLKEQKLAFVRAILERKAFHEYFGKVLENGGNQLEKDEVVKIIVKHATNIKDDTLSRRSLTLKSWVHWIFDLARVGG